MRRRRRQKKAASVKMKSAATKRLTLTVDRHRKRTGPNCRLAGFEGCYSLGWTAPKPAEQISRGRCHGKGQR